MKRTIRIPLVLVILLVLIAIVCVKSNASTTGVITEITVNVREKASIDSKVIMFVTQDDKVEILEKTGDWYKIKYNKKEGYVYSDFVKVDSDSKISSNDEEQIEIENADETIPLIEAKLLLQKDTGVRIAPNITSNIIYTVTSDIEISNILEEINGWSYIKVNNIKGWVRSDQIKEGSEDEEIVEDKNTELLSIEKQTDTENETSDTNTTSRDGETTSRTTSQTTQTTSTTNTTKKEEVKNNSEEKTKASTNKGEEIVAYAKQYLGYAYVYGGSSPETGFDCSGFTSYVYKHFGYTLSRSSVGQASDGTKVSKQDLKPGDLVIYKNTSLTRIGHVGIYIGDNKMIHASEPGVGVIITDIDSKAHNYPKRFVMGRRIVK